METLNYLGEEWRDIKGYENYYQISNYGRVRSLERTITCKNGINKKYCARILKPSVDRVGYLFKCINGKCYKIHRLVAFAFPEICGEYFEGAEVNHKNAIKTDNRAENLEWITHKQNCNYGTHNNRMAESHKKWLYQYDTNYNLVKIWKSVTDASNELGYIRVNLYRCISGNRKTAYGYIWRYK